MDCIDLLVVAFAVGFGFYFGKDSYFTLMDFVGRVGDETNSRRFKGYLLLGFFLVVLVFMLAVVKIPF